MRAGTRLRTAFAVACCGVASLACGPVMAGLEIYTGDPVPERPATEFAPGPSDRLALVISIETYDAQRYGMLETPTADGDAIADALSDAGYRIMRVRDADHAGLTDSLQTFNEAIEGDSTVVVYYAGLGVGLPFERDNRILPADFPEEIPDTNSAVWKMISKGTVTLTGDLLGSIIAHNPKGLFAFYDACRADPFDGVIPLQRYEETMPCRPIAISDAAVLYASSADEPSLRAISAADPSETSVFPRALLDVLKDEADTAITPMMEKVRDTADIFTCTRMMPKFLMLLIKT